jgi:hypothetical protein
MSLLFAIGIVSGWKSAILTTINPLGGGNHAYRHHRIGAFEYS